MCDKSFYTAFKLKMHLRVHSDERPYICNQCDKSFRWWNSWKVHQKWHDGLKPHKCSSCDYKTLYKSHLVEHRRLHTGEKPHKCSHCDKEFRTKASLLFHIRIHSGEKPYSCPHCERRFSQWSTLRGHISTHTGEKLYQCSICDKEFKSKKCAYKHYAVVHKNEISSSGKSYSCSQCKKVFIDLAGVETTIRSTEPVQQSDAGENFGLVSDSSHANVSSTGVKYFKCDVCSTWNNSNQVGLKLSHHSSHPKIKVKKRQFSEKTFKGEEFSGQSSADKPSFLPNKKDFSNKCSKQPKVVRTQISLNNEKQKINCHICNKQFKKESLLVSHLKTHTCGKCGDVFENEDNLRMHRKTHRDEKCFKCDFCEKKFKDKGHCNRHMWIHAESKPHNCSECRKSFADISQLQRHKKCHLEKRFHCNDCGKWYRWEFYFKKHRCKKRKEGQNSFMCDNCGKSFDKAASLKTHKSSPCQKQLKVDTSALSVEVVTLV